MLIPLDFLACSVAYTIGFWEILASQGYESHRLPIYPYLCHGWHYQEKDDV